jgi:hypothetical protein
VCVETKAILRALLPKHKFSKWHKTKTAIHMRFSFMTNKQIKKIHVSFFFYVLKFSRFIAQPCISTPSMFLSANPVTGHSLNSFVFVCAQASFDRKLKEN